MLKKKIALVLALAMTASLALAGCGGGGGTGSSGGSSSGSGAGAQTGGEKTTQVLATGGTTGTYYSVGSTMMNTLNDKLTMTSLEVTSTGASKDNVQGITDDLYGLAILQSDVLTYAHEGTNVFADSGSETDALWVAGLYNETVQITAVGGITSVEDLRGKSVCVGDVGSGTEFNAQQVLDAYGMTFDDIDAVHTDFGGASEMLKNGQIDAAFTVAGAPTTAITELATSGMDFSMVSLDQEHVDIITEKYPFLVQENLPAGTYQGIDTETICVAVQAVLVASTDMSEDAVYELTKAMYENQEALASGNAKFELLNPVTAVSGASVPLHPGALKYYQEIGVLDADGNLVEQA